MSNSERLRTAEVLFCAQESQHHFIETYSFGTGYLDRAVYRRPERDFETSEVKIPTSVTRSARLTLLLRPVDSFDEPAL